MTLNAYTRRFSGKIVESDGIKLYTPEPITLRFTITAAAPTAVKVEFIRENATDAFVEWRFARSIIGETLETGAGPAIPGDVTLMKLDGEIRMVVRSDSGEAIITFGPIAELGFFNRTAVREIPDVVPDADVDAFIASCIEAAQ